ncbi:MAG: D-alanyl-D-alanine carboxypeptidase family protein [Anaerolineae bacterium]
MKIFIVCLGSFLLCSLMVYGELLKVQVSSPSAILMNAESGVILYEKDSYSLLHPGSITKIATALFVLDRKIAHLEDLVTATQDAVAIVPAHLKQADFSKYPSHRLEHDGSMMGIKAGEVLPFRTLLYGLMLASGNDAANVIAEHVSGSSVVFISELNQYLKEKGIKDTVFYNAHGLPHPNHLTTAYEMAKMTRLALQIPFFREIVKTTKYPRTFSGGQTAKEITAHNSLLRPGKYFYPKAIGVKTGHTAKAGYPIVAAAEHQGRTLIVVLLGCKSIHERYEDAIALFDAAFAQKIVKRTLFAQDRDRYTLKLKESKIPVEAVLKENVTLSYYPAEEPDFKAYLHWHDVKLPIAKGDLIGEIQLKTSQGDILKTGPLFASNSVNKTLISCCLDFFKDHTMISLLLLITVSLFLVIIFFKGLSKTCIKKDVSNEKGKGNLVK